MAGSITPTGTRNPFNRKVSANSIAALSEADGSSVVKILDSCKYLRATTGGHFLPCSNASRLQSS
jgi:hypothetical protein